MSNNVFVATIKYIFVEVLWDIVYFPIWWYTKGLARVARYCWQSVYTQAKRRLALGVWLSSMFKPMYGDYTVEGRIISGVMRFFVLIWKLILLVLWMIVLFAVLVLWIILPVAIVYYFLYQVFNLPFGLMPS
jgi:hypothetical protein